MKNLLPPSATLLTAQTPQLRYSRPFGATLALLSAVLHACTAGLDTHGLGMAAMGMLSRGVRTLAPSHGPIYLK